MFTKTRLYCRHKTLLDAENHINSIINKNGVNSTNCGIDTNETHGLHVWIDRMTWKETKHDDE